jgi:hypothetical protein
MLSAPFFPDSDSRHGTRSSWERSICICNLKKVIRTTQDRSTDDDVQDTFPGNSRDRSRRNKTEQNISLHSIETRPLGQDEDDSNATLGQYSP